VVVPLAYRSTNDVVMTINSDETSYLHSLVVGNVLGKDQYTGLSYRPVTLGEPTFGNPELGQNESAADTNNFGEPIWAPVVSGLHDNIDPDPLALLARQPLWNWAWCERMADPPQVLLDYTFIPGIPSNMAQEIPPFDSLSIARILSNGQNAPRPLRGSKSPELLGRWGLACHAANCAEPAYSHQAARAARVCSKVPSIWDYVSPWIWKRRRAMHGDSQTRVDTSSEKTPSHQVGFLGEGLLGFDESVNEATELWERPQCSQIRCLKKSSVTKATEKDRHNCASHSLGLRECCSESTCELKTNEDLRLNLILIDASLLESGDCGPQSLAEQHKATVVSLSWACRPFGNANVLSYCARATTWECCTCSPLSKREERCNFNIKYRI
jgi:hypothetical protein